MEKTFETMYCAVIVKETLERKVWVEAASHDDAVEQVREMYDNGQVVLDWENLTDVEFIETGETKFEQR